ncbi:MAG: acyl carrier protein [Planctomycetaceae bacterium]|nr:acyl carrier protein [Planctomycetaceae bacterium]
MRAEKEQHSETSGITAADIEHWLILQIAEELRVDPEGIRVDQPLLSHGIDSMQVVSIVAKLEDWLSIRFAGNPLEDYSTIEQLAQHVAELKST